MIYIHEYKNRNYTLLLYVAHLMRQAHECIELSATQIKLTVDYVLIKTLTCCGFNTIEKLVSAVCLIK